MKTTKTVEVILLLTDIRTQRSSNIYLDKQNNKLNFGFIQNEFNYMQHLYFVDDSEIKTDDWCMMADKTSKLFGLLEKHKGIHERNNQWSKIISSTDKNLYQVIQVNIKHTDSIKFYLPQIPQSFIEHYITEYNKSNVITSIELECEEQIVEDTSKDYITGLGQPCCSVYKLKIDQNNCCIPIINVKTSWSRKEVMIVAYKNNGWKPNMKDDNQKKHYCWFYNSPFHFSHSTCNASASVVASSLLLQDDCKCKEMVEEFIFELEQSRTTLAY